MHLTRRRMLQGAAGVLAAGTIAVSQTVRGEDQPSAESEKAVVKGRLKQSVCAWCYKMKLDELAQNAAAIGLKSVELVDSKDWPILKKHGLICAMTPSHDIGEGFNNKDNHEKCIAAVKKSIDACVEAGFPNVITFSGNRNGMSDDVGLENTVEGLKNVIGYAEQKKVNVCIEILNSRLNHKDYMCDTVEWAAEVCKRIASPRMKILFDIYHVSAAGRHYCPDQAVSRVHRPLSYCRRAGPSRVGRKSGAKLPRHHAGHCRKRFSRLHRPGIHTHPRSHEIAQRSRAPVRRVKHPYLRGMRFMDYAEIFCPFLCGS